jgi:lipopolysaccharide transport system ATP-binding protein
MSHVAIRAEGLSKQYHIGATRPRYRTFREALVDAAAGPFRRTAKLLRGQATGAAELNEILWALKDISFEIHHGEVVGIIGHNGAGKSTLLKILSRITEPSEGYAEIRGRVGSLLEVGTGFHPELTGRENIYLNAAILGMKKVDIDSKFEEIVAFSEVERFLDTPVKHYSSGMYLRLAFAVAAHLEPEILLVDEVLAVGDASFQKKCLGKMENVAREGRTVLFVSHNMGAVRNLCSRVLLLNAGRIQSSGPAEDVIREYLSMAHAEQRKYTLAERQDRSGNGNVRVVSFQARARDSNGAPRTAAGAEFLVGYAARSEQPITRLYVGIGVTDALGTSVTWFSTAMTNSDFCGIPPKGQIVCQIDWLPLIPGRYRVDIKLIDDRGHADLVRFAASFDVVDGGDSGFTAFASGDSGSVVVPHSWFLDSLD